MNNFFSSYALDFLFMTETWLKPDDLSSLGELSPPDCSFYSSPRPNGSGGGLATIFKKSFKCQLLPVDAFSSFEAQLLHIDLDGPLIFLSWFTDHPKLAQRLFMSSQTSCQIKCHAVIDCWFWGILISVFAAPLNLWLKILWISLTRSVSHSVSLLPTHNLGHTLDLILTIFRFLFLG